MYKITEKIVYYVFSLIYFWKEKIGLQSRWENMDFKEFELNSSELVYMQIVEYIKRKILRKEVKSGEKLPSRREVAAALQINPNTVQKAYKILEEENYVITPPKAASYFNITDDILLRLEEEMNKGMILKFVDNAKRNGLTLDKVVILLENYWSEEKKID